MEEHGSGPQSVSNPTVGTSRPKRADAARNRDRVLDATRRLLEDRSLDALSMDEVAAAAGVGKGTVFRAVTDKAGLAAALLDDAERRLQAGILHGPPPLGPGAEPAARVLAFADAYLAFVERHADLLLVVDAGAPTARYRTSAYGGWLLHLRTQLRIADPSRDAEADAHAILALLDPALVRHLRTEARVSRARVRAMVARATAAIVTPG